MPRTFMTVVCAAALAMGTGWAQRTAVPALADEIRASESLVQEPSAQNDGAAWWRLGMFYQDAARYQDAERAYTRALALLKSGDRTTLANAMDSMGTMYVETGAYAQAEPLETEALAIRQEQNDSIGMGRSWMHLAMLSIGKHDTPDAVHYAEMAVKRLVYDRSSGIPQATPEEKMTALIDLGLARCANGQCHAAMGNLKMAREMARSSYAASGFPVGYTDFLLGYAYWQTGHARSAAELMKSGISSLQVQLGIQHPTCRAAMIQYATFLDQTGHKAQAAEVKEKILDAPAAERASTEASLAAPAQ